MSRIVRWNPVREMMALQNAMNRLMDESFDDLTPGMRRWDLAVDLVETDDSFVVKASLPGITPEDMDITVEDDTLTIKAETKVEEEYEQNSYHLRERRFGGFSRSLRLPTAINAEKIEAVFEHGVLTLTVPKAEAVKPKKISVRSIIEG